MGEPPDRPLTGRDLNRATLARQLLLERSPLDPVAAIRQVLALQAQEPASPYLALWTRVASFDAAALDAAITSRDVVKATVMRMTLHLVAAEDYPAFWAAHAPANRRSRSQRLGLDARGVTPELLDELIELALTYADHPRSNQELAEHLATVGGQLDVRDWWWAIRVMTPFVQAAGHTEAPALWSYGRRPAFVAARSWLTMPEVDPDAALDAVVRRYLVAFGPATVVDVAQFTKLARAPIRASVERLRPTLRILVDTEGQELFDVPDGPLPDPDTPAPVRYLPMWDSVLLAYDNRARLIPRAYKRVIIRTNGDVLPTFLVDGQVAGVWRAELVGGRTKIVRHAFGRLSKRTNAELDGEASALADFVEPHEPEVFRRYRRWWSDLTP